MGGKNPEHYLKIPGVKFSSLLHHIWVGESSMENENSRIIEVGKTLQACQIQLLMDQHLSKAMRGVEEFLGKPPWAPPDHPFQKEIPEISRKSFLVIPNWNGSQRNSTKFFPGKLIPAFYHPSKSTSENLLMKRRGEKHKLSQNPNKSQEFQMSEGILALELPWDGLRWEFPINPGNSQ